MKKAPVRLSSSIGVLLVVSAALLYSTRSRSVIFSFSQDPDMIRPRTYCLLNPFRDRSPEIIAEKYLKDLRAGDIESIRPFLSEEESPRILDNEKRWPIQSWRLGDRIDRPEETELIFWVRRERGYSKDIYEEEVRLWIKRSGGRWSLNTYSAIY
ncbi:MAG: hypothetical protein J2P52_05975 [Blastocatellia bacterium]|nr:hypothetical protein [Blastocatellia bacterium]